MKASLEDALLFLGTWKSDESKLHVFLVDSKADLTASLLAMVATISGRDVTCNFIGGLTTAPVWSFCFRLSDECVFDFTEPGDRDPLFSVALGPRYETALRICFPSGVQLLLLKINETS